MCRVTARMAPLGGCGALGEAQSSMSRGGGVGGSWRKRERRGQIAAACAYAGARSRPDGMREADNHLCELSSGRSFVTPGPDLYSRTLCNPSNGRLACRAAHRVRTCVCGCTHFAVL
jgi:hypothetical protein